MKTFSAVGIVLKRVDVGELDRIVTIFTREQGKITCVAKGARKLTSSKLASLEPGSLVKAHFAVTKSLPILTQTQLVEDHAVLKTDLPSIRNLFQILEMLDAVLAEGDEASEVFEIAEKLLTQMKNKQVNKTQAVRSAFTRILAILGFGEGEVDLSKPLIGLIEDLTQRKMRSFAYLSS